MASHPVTKDDLGNYFLRSDGSVWRVLSYTDRPTVEFVCVAGDERHRTLALVTTSLLAKEFRRLVPEGP